MIINFNLITQKKVWLWKYLDTVMTNKGELVWHAFYKNWV